MMLLHSKKNWTAQREDPSVKKKKKSKTKIELVLATSFCKSKRILTKEKSFFKMKKKFFLEHRS